MGDGCRGAAKIFVRWDGEEGAAILVVERPVGRDVLRQRRWGRTWDMPQLWLRGFDQVFAVGDDPCNAIVRIDDICDLGVDGHIVRFDACQWVPLGSDIVCFTYIQHRYDRSDHTPLIRAVHERHALSRLSEQ